MYLAFDLDSTLGDFMGAYPVLCALRRETVGKSPVQIKYPSTEFAEKIANAYRFFVQTVARAENSANPLGLFRPGIFELLAEVVKLKKKGECDGVIIYSNNGCKAVLEFVRDVVASHFNYKLFDDIIHFHHSLRIKPISSNSPVVDVRKNWVELKQILVDGVCKAAPSIETCDVMFFDDQIHADLFEKLGKKYIKVSSYEMEPDMKEIVNIYKTVLRRANLIDDAAFLTYAREGLRNVHSLDNYFQQITGVYTNSLVREKEKEKEKEKRDTGIKIMTRAIKTISKKKRVRASATSRRLVKNLRDY
jgi:hypothetical protein